MRSINANNTYLNIKSIQIEIITQKNIREILSKAYM